MIGFSIFFGTFAAVIFAISYTIFGFRIRKALPEGFTYFDRHPDRHCPKCENERHTTSKHCTCYECPVGHFHMKCDECKYPWTMLEKGAKF